MYSANSLLLCICFQIPVFSESINVSGVCVLFEVILNNEFLEMESLVPQFCPLCSDHLGQIAFGKFVLIYTRTRCG